MISSFPFLRAWMCPEFIDHQGWRERLLSVREKTSFPRTLWCAGRNVAQSMPWRGANFFLFLPRQHLHNDVYLPHLSAHGVWFSLLFVRAAPKWRQCRKLVSLFSSIKCGSADAFSLARVSHHEGLVSLWYRTVLFLRCLRAVTCQTGPAVFGCCPIRHTFRTIIFLSPFGFSSPFSPCRSPPQGGCLDFPV